MKLEELDFNQTISKEEYQAKLEKLQLELLHCEQRLVEKKRSLLLVFEGPDASGKGGVIQRIMERMDLRPVKVYSIMKPTEEEYLHHYLWRFWNKLPKRGEIAIFDRSWYGRVLVERVEGFASTQEWKRAYDELNMFEKMLMEDGAIVMKFYLQVTPEEQLKRFKKRQSNPFKSWKINEEDWRNRKKSSKYVVAAEEMFERTSTEGAPWEVIPGNFKWWARIRVLKLMVKKLKAELGEGAAEPEQKKVSRRGKSR